MKANNDNSDKELDEFLDQLGKMFEVEHFRRDFDKEDRLLGTYVRYKSGLEVYHPYVPLQMNHGDGKVTEGPRPTRTELALGVPFKTRYDVIH